MIILIDKRRETKMAAKKSLRCICLTGLFIFIISFLLLVHLQAQTRDGAAGPGKDGQQTEREQVKKEEGFSLKDWIPLGLLFVAVASLSINVYLLLQRKKHKKQDKVLELEAAKEFEENERKREAWTAEEMYANALKGELGTIDMLGSPDIESKTVKLEDAFVSLCISESWKSEERFQPDKKMEAFYDRHLTPEQAMKRAFQQFRLFLVIGDPGSGKTTLLKYYAVNCLNKKYREFGFKGEVFPIYLPLRELTFEDNDPVSLTRDLAKWSERHLLNISEKQFQDWLQNSKTLVLLDGLDEISSKDRRRKVCRWVNNMCAGLKNACFVVTSRSTGYRKLDGIELKTPHLRADIMDFSPGLQEVFLKKWFRAAFLSGVPPEGMGEREWKVKRLKLAEQRSKPIIDFLKNEKNKAVRDLAAVPMLLQIMAIIWKDRKHLPDSRSALYDAALNYLLVHRDKEKEIESLLPVEQSRRVLTPTALWMQEELQRDEAPKAAMHEKMRPILKTLEGQPEALTFCEYLRDRAGLIADYDKEHYIFRHKSFREFLSALQMVKDAHRENRIETLVEYFKEDWWEEALRFFMSKADDDMFDGFMRLLFQSPVSRELNANQQTLLQDFVREAPQRKVDALKDALNSGDLNDNQERYVMDCLKIIGTPEAIEAIEAFIEKSKDDEANLDHARDIVWELSGETSKVEELAEKDRHVSKPGSIRNPFEGNVEYIKIPGSTYKYSRSREMVTVPDLYFCKYPVTNKRYRRFIAYLAGKEKELLQRLPLKRFALELSAFAETIKGYNEYLGNDSKKWREKLRSRLDEDKRFNGDDQPVVGVTWYDASSYCFWLSCLEAILSNTGAGTLYRLPTEEEWEWAAGGEPDGSVREYPWPKEKGEPNPNLANYEENVGATTPVGRYPEGATPHGLMDMAGNVWEWMDNYYSEEKITFAIRGGSWSTGASVLRCSARVRNYPRDYRNVVDGFRVRRGSAPGHKLKL
jgi:formylglycine-generating enzyme required for sulfatase activity